MASPVLLHRTRRLRAKLLAVLVPILCLRAVELHAQAAGNDPWENAVTVLRTAFTGTIATGLSLVAIVLGGLMFAYGEGQSKRVVAGIVFGVGMAIGDESEEVVGSRSGVDGGYHIESLPCGAAGTYDYQRFGVGDRRRRTQRRAGRQRPDRGGFRQRA